MIGLIGTGWNENGKDYNQVRVVDAQGELVSVYAKTCLTYGDAKEFAPGPISMVPFCRRMPIRDGLVRWL